MITIELANVRNIEALNKCGPDIRAKTVSHSLPNMVCAIIRRGGLVCKVTQQLSDVLNCGTFVCDAVL